MLERFLNWLDYWFHHWFHHVPEAHFYHPARHVNWDSIALSATALGTLILAGGVIVALFGLWDSKKTRHGALVTELSARWDDFPVSESLQLFSQHGPHGVIELVERVYTGTTIDTADLSLLSRLTRFPDLIEAVGVLWDEGVIALEVVYKMWGPQILVAWLVWEQPVARIRELDAYPIAYRYFEKLAEALEKEWAKDPAAVAAGSPSAPSAPQEEEAGPAARVDQ
jgi:hypothetical protein